MFMIVKNPPGFEKRKATDFQRAQYIKVNDALEVDQLNGKLVATLQNVNKTSS